MTAADALEAGVIMHAYVYPETIPDLRAILGEETPESTAFADPWWRSVWRTILDLADHDQPVDPVTVNFRLDPRNDIEPLRSALEVSGVPLGGPQNGVALARILAQARQGQTLGSTLDRLRARLRPPFAADTGAVLAEVEEAAAHLRAEMAGSGATIPWAQTVADTVDAWDARRSGRERRGVTTGWPEIDGLLVRLRPGQLILLAGRPGIGKTSMALQIAAHAAGTEGRPVALVSLEMDRCELTERVLCVEGGVPASLPESAVRTMLAAAGRVSEWPVAVADGSTATVGQIRAFVAVVRARHGSVGLIVVDYLQLVRARNRRGTLYEQVCEVSRDLKLLARDMDAPVLALSQLSRKVEDRDSGRPKLSDLRDSGSLEQDSDVVLLLSHHAKQVRGREREAEPLILCEIAKHRSGPTGRALFRFTPWMTRFVPATWPAGDAE